MQILKYVTMPICALLSFLVMADVASAQRGGGGRGGPQTRARFELATLPEVQAELKLNDEQKKLATDLLAKQREKRQSFGRGGDFQAMRTELEKLNSQLEAEFVAVLDAAQKMRMHGLIAQVNGFAALMDADIAKALKMTSDQIAKLTKVNDANQAARREAMQGLQDASQEERRATVEKLTTDSNNAMVAVLNDEQKKNFEALKGSPLAIDQSPLRTQGGRTRGN